MLPLRTTRAARCDSPGLQKDAILGKSRNVTKGAVDDQRRLKIEGLVPA